VNSEEEPRQRRFWRLVATTVGGAVLLSSLYVVVGPSLGTVSENQRLWSDALCVSALLLGLGAGIPFLLDAGRGLTLPGKMGTSRESRGQVWDEERAKRERGIQITFALVLAALLTGIISLIASLL
jgi:hypothetical protein